MTDIVERLRRATCRVPCSFGTFQSPNQPMDCACAASMDAADEIERLRKEIKWLNESTPSGVLEVNPTEIERLTIENWQLKQACGYPIPADMETVRNPFKCGTCDAKAAEIERLTDALATCRELRKYDQEEIKRLRAEIKLVSK